MLVPVADLVGNPGATRSLQRTVALGDIGDDPWGPAQDAVGDELTLDLGLDSVIEGIWVHGRVGWHLTIDCGRCLRPVRLDREAEIGELFADAARIEAPDDLDDGYMLVEFGSAIDLERMLHDVVVLDLPTSVRCGRDDCRAPTGPGVTVLTEDQVHAAVEAAPDPRWSALAELQLDD